MSAAPKWVPVGKLLREWGVKGQARCLVFNPQSEILLQTDHVFRNQGGEYLSLKIEDARRHGKFWLVKFAGYDQPETMRELRSSDLFLPRDQLPELQPGELYLTDLIGLTVLGPQSEPLGEIVNFVHTGEPPVLAIRTAQGQECFVPYEKDFISETQREAGRLVLTDLGKEVAEVNLK